MTIESTFIWAINQSDLKPLHKLLALVLAHHADGKTGLSTASIDQIAAYSGMSRRTAINNLQAMHDNGIVEKITSPGKPNAYKLLQSTSALPAPVKTKRSKPDFDQNDPGIMGLNTEAWSDWIEYRKARRLPRYASNRGAKELASYDYETQAAAVDEAIRKNWNGLYPKKSTRQPGNVAAGINDAMQRFLNND